MPLSVSGACLQTCARKDPTNVVHPIPRPALGACRRHPSLQHTRDISLHGVEGYSASQYPTHMWATMTQESGDNDQTEPNRIAQWWRGKNVMITGASGYIGKAIVEKLLRMQPEVRVKLCRYQTVSR